MTSGYNGGKFSCACGRIFDGQHDNMKAIARMHIKVCKEYNKQPIICSETLVPIDKHYNVKREVLKDMSAQQLGEFFPK